MDLSPNIPVKAYLETPHGQLHYVSLVPPDARPFPVLLLHMSASSSRSFHSLMRDLSSSRYASYAIDLPGFGSSFDPASDPPSITWYADLFHAALLKGLPAAFTSGCHIVGHHSGGVIGTELAVKYPGFCSSLTLIGPTVMSAEERLTMSKTFGDPFNKPVESGEHLLETWNYLKWEGLAPHIHLELMQRETLDHIRAWEGRSQIYACVWAYDMEAALERITADDHDTCPILGLCAPDDILWPYFENFKAFAGPEVVAKEIAGGNFGPDLDSGLIAVILAKFIDEQG